MSLELRGQLLQILPVQSGTSKAGNEWSKQEFVVETDEQFPRKVCFTLFGDKTSLLNGISVGDKIEVAFNVESHEYSGRWYHNINAWRINAVEPPDGNAAPPFSADDVPPTSDMPDAPPVDDLPF